MRELTTLVIVYPYYFDVYNELVMLSTCNISYTM